MRKRTERAHAEIRGGANFPNLRGVVTFTQTPRGVLITANVDGLPVQNSCRDEGIFGFHIHEGDSCTGDPRDEFANTGAHFNPYGCPHPYHAGDLPPLFSNGGYAYMQVLSDRFTVSQIIGRTAVIHDMPDDFKTQPSGDSGMKIACGTIVRG